MRKIEQEMVNALESGKRLNKGNMEVTARYRIPNGYMAKVKLHGNLIAEAYFDGMGREYPRLLRVTLAGWGTPTTRSRLNALGRHFTGRAVAHQAKHEQYINDVPVGTRDWVVIRGDHTFVNNMRGGALC